MPDSLKNDLRKAGSSFSETTSLDKVIATTDVLYVTRVQQERFASANEYESVKDAYIVDNQVSLHLLHLIVQRADTCCHFSFWPKPNPT